MMQILFTIALLGIFNPVLLIVAAPIEISEVEHTHVFSAIEENDLFYNPKDGDHQDRHYTQGLKFIYLESGSPWWAKGLGLPQLSEHLPNLGIEPESSSFGIALGQNIYTPENRQATTLLRYDRPYAGWLYLGAVLQRRGVVLEKIPVLESFELDMGIIGPEAQAGQSQNKVHDFEDIPGFDGWGNQIKFEPSFVLKYGRAWKLAFNEASGHYFDMIPNIGANLGTVMVSANVGVSTRVGFNLPDDFGVQTIDSAITLSPGKSPSPIGAYVFGKVEGRAVGRNVFLDGNLYRDSFHVKKEPLVGDLIYGAALSIGKHFDLSYTRVVRTREFVLQKGYDRFGSIVATLKWGF
ncbi:MAG: lipid A deacylase LpxR family protein [Verrucomicrobiota bacterium]